MQPLQSRQINTGLDRRRDILLLIFSIVGILGLLVRGAILAFTGIKNITTGDSTSLASSMLGSLAMLFCAGLLLPMLIYTLRHLKGREILPAKIQPVKGWQGMMLAIGWILTIIIGAVLVSQFNYGWVAAAPLFLLGISLPILSLIWLGIGGLPGGSLRRLWSVFGISMVGSTLAAVFLEYLVVGIAVVVFAIIAVASPELRTFLEQIKTLVTNAQTGDMQALLTILAPYITNPLVIVIIMVFAAVIGPMIEEFVKPAVIWFLGKRLRSPAEGFVLGALCGAGFALIEGLLSASGSIQMWGFGLIGRAAASLMHITSSGILGWAIASARLEKRYGQLGLIYLLSVSIHGLWNGSAIMTVYGALRTMVQNSQVVQNSQFDILGALLIVGGIGMLFLELVLMLIMLPLINRWLRRAPARILASAQSDIIAPPSASNSRENNGLDS